MVGSAVGKVESWTSVKLTSVSSVTGVLSGALWLAVSPFFPDTSHTYITQRLGRRTAFPSTSPRNVWLERPHSQLPWRNGRPWEYHGVSPVGGSWRAQGWIIEELIIWKFCNQLTCLRYCPKIPVVSGKYSGPATHKTWTRIFFPAPDATP